MATFRGYVRAHGAKPTARLLSQLTGKRVSDSTVREAFTGKPSHKGRRTDHTVFEANAVAYNEAIRTATGKTPPGKLTPPPLAEPFYDVSMGLRGMPTQDAVQAGVRFDAMGQPLPPPGRKSLPQLSQTALNKLLSEANRRWYGQDVIVSVYGTRRNASGSRPGDSDPVTGFKTGWFAKRVPAGTGTVHAFMQYADDAKGIVQDELANLPKGVTPQVERHEQHAIRGHYVPYWAELVNQQEWEAIYAVWIRPAKSY